ncbi:MAG: ABC transporter substrate-binding protein [Actinobacteria bacterium]|nr:ABC transporter substrate-binding protein [Actinomycetota bacterium]
MYPASTEPGALEQLHGLETAAALANESGGVNGREVKIDSEDATHDTAVQAAVDNLVRRGASVIFGTYDSALALVASAEASQDGVTFMETGGLADTITRRGLRGVLRSGQSGSTLGAYAVEFAHDFVVPTLRLSLRQARIVVIFADDPYGSSVAYGAVTEAAALGMNIVDTIKYVPSTTDYYYTLASELQADHPDVVISGQYLADAAGLREAMTVRGMKLGALIGASSTYSSLAYPETVGSGALGVFAVDGPDQGMGRAGLLPGASRLLDQAIATYRAGYHTAMSSSAIEGFVGGWIMFHDILPHAMTASRDDVISAADSLDLPSGSEVNGSGVKFAPQGKANAGDNTMADAVVWQWRTTAMRYIVYPPAFAQTRPNALQMT